MSFEILISWAIEKWSEVLLYVIWNPRKQQNHSVDSFTGHPVCTSTNNEIYYIYYPVGTNVRRLMQKTQDEARFKALD